MLLLIGIPLSSSVFGPATNLSLWDDVAGGCTGTEKRLSDCPRGPASVTCRRTGVAGVRCYSDSSSKMKSMPTQSYLYACTIFK